MSEADISNIGRFSLRGVILTHRRENVEDNSYGVGVCDHMGLNSPPPVSKFNV